MKQKGSEEERRVVKVFVCFYVFFFFKQKTAYEIKECDWSSDVCSSDLYCASRSYVLYRFTKPSMVISLHVPKRMKYAAMKSVIAFMRFHPVYSCRVAVKRSIEIGRASCRERV